MISNCPHFCASQTLVNGLQHIDNKLYQGSRLTTFKGFLNYLYPNWSTPYAMVKQYTEIDNIVRNDLYSTEDLRKSNMYKSFVFNADDVQKSIRTLFELNVKYHDISIEQLTEEQKYITDIYKNILERPAVYKSFKLESDLSEEKIDEAIKNALIRDHEYYVESVDSYDLSKVVIHGIHQFSALELRAIEELSKVKDVILIFNYQDQYKTIYQTWQDVYDNFESDIQFSNKLEYRPTDPESSCYLSNILGDNMGMVCEGKRPSVNLSGRLALTEFDSMTEFAGYVASKYEDAVIRKAHDTSPSKEKRSVLSYMSEKFYSADGSVNDILRIYFPEQFGERQFLNYPLGHFFLAIANMWNPCAKEMQIEDLNDVKECIYSSIIQEKQKGELLTIFEKASSLFEGCNSIKAILKRLKRLKKNLTNAGDEDREIISRLSYYSLSIDEIEALSKGLEELNDIAELFFADFETHPDNFKSFYEKLQNYLSDILVNSEGIDEEFRDILVRVLERLDQVSNINASASFDCLKATMAIYLQQEVTIGNSARWIVKNFEQIDGDVLQSTAERGEVYHFACLSDDDINSRGRREFSWPLDQKFFEVAQNPVDWKYQVFVTASTEYKNFKRYALIYGLEFNRARVKLSFVKKGQKADKEPYYLLKMLGIKEKGHYKDLSQADRMITLTSRSASTDAIFDRFDMYRFRMCNYRFLLESIMEKGTIYKDSFLQLRYFEAVLERSARERLVGDIVSISTVMPTVEEEYEGLSRYFPFATAVNKADIVKAVTDRLLWKKKGTFEPVKQSDVEKYQIKERFCVTDFDLKDIFNPINDKSANEQLANEKLEGSSFVANVSSVCKFCANKDICLMMYRGQFEG